MEHLQHFQLSDDPFRNEALIRVLFEDGPQEDALRRLERSVRQARGLSVLIGASGSGKTITVRRLLDRCRAVSPRDGPGPVRAER